jgi:hypothetical protein
VNKFFKNLFDILSRPFKALSAWLQQVKEFSWQMLLLLTVLSWLTALVVSNPYVREILARLGWIFLILGVGWALGTEKPFKEPFKDPIFGLEFRIGPWVTGALVSAFVFYGLPNGLALGLTTWPLFSAAIALIPKFVKHKRDLVNPFYAQPDEKLVAARQNMIFTILNSILLSCWLQFHFLTLSWLDQFPSLIIDDFSRSNFVVKLTEGSTTSSRGLALLNETENVLRRELEPLPWPAVERWLQNIRNETETLKAQAVAALPTEGSAENQLWDLRAEVIPGAPLYTVRFQSWWLGPSSKPAGFYAEKVCLITRSPVSGVTGAATLGIPSSRIECQPAVDGVGVR